MRDLIKSVERQMVAKIEEARQKFEHRGDKGSNVEGVVREFLRQYLPRRLAVGHGEVIDRQDRRSAQVDVVIANEDHPFTFTPEQPGLFFIEGVSGAGEVKTVLTGQELERSVDASRKFKALRGDHTGNMTCSNPGDLRRWAENPPFFLFAFESQLTLDTIFNRLTELGNEINTVIDGVFVVGKGSIINFGDGEGSFQFRDATGRSLPGWQRLRSDHVVFDFLGWLSVTMPRMQRFSPILGRYLVPSS